MLVDRGADSPNVQRRRVLLAVLCALSLCALAAASAPAVAATTASAPKRSAHHRSSRHRARHASCARRASFHSIAGHRRRSTTAHHRRSKRRARCLRRAAHRRHRRGSHRHSSPRHRAHAPRHHGTRLRRRATRHAHLHRTPAAAKSSACPDTNLTPNEADLERIRAATLCLVNRERTERGEAALSIDPRLQQAAQAHTEDMAFGDYFAHVGRRGDTPVSRMRASGYIYSSQIGYAIGENIAWGTLWLATPRAIVDAWMASPEHRAN